MMKNMAQYFHLRGASVKRYANVFANTQGKTDVPSDRRNDIQSSHIKFLDSADLKDVLAKKHPQIDVKELLKGLQLTIEFENQLAKRFSQQVRSRNIYMNARTAKYLLLSLGSG